MFRLQALDFVHEQIWSPKPSHSRRPDTVVISDRTLLQKLHPAAIPRSRSATTSIRACRIPT